jgi:hypothetical protein
LWGRYGPEVSLTTTHYTKARPAAMQDLIVPVLGGDEAIRMGYTEWGEWDRQDDKNLIINQDITTELSDRRRNQRPEAATARLNPCTKRLGRCGI